MNLDNPNLFTPPKGRVRHWLRVLRPLVWWGILILVLYTYRLHQRLIAQTRITFSVSLGGQPIAYGASARLDGQNLLSGGRVTLGQHTFSVTHPKGESFSTNLFVWYGPHDFGEIALKRATGTLSVQVEPPAPLLTIRGQELALTLTNSAGLSRSVPTDLYRIEATYRHWQGAQEITVSPNSVGASQFVPRIGNLQLACNQTGATFQLLNANGTVVETGDFPSTVYDLPQGSYKVMAVHHDNRQEVSGFVETGLTRSLKVEFVYGAAHLETKPSGATVESGDGHSWGVTPLQLEGLRPGQWEFVLRRDGYESAHCSLDVAANQTNSFSTNLVSTSYVRALESARQYLKRADYKRALESSSEALVANPSDPEATAIQREATKQDTLIRAKALAAKGDYDAATGELEVALLTVPEDGELKQLLTDYRKRNEDRAERRRQEETSQAAVIFKTMLGNNKDAGLFEHHELKSKKAFWDVESVIRTSLQNVQPPFTVNELKSPDPNVFILEAKEQLPGGVRQCLIVGGQTFPDETQIFYETLEYTTGQNVSVLGVLNVKSDFILTPIHPSRVEQMTNALQNQITEGSLIVTRLMARASE